MNNWWQKFANFLHTANLIPLVVIVSTYHYYQALRSHDPLLVSLPIALFIDLLHYRTVQRAVNVGKTNWKLAAMFTTLLAFGLQWIFYNQPVAGEILIWWQAILFASIVPVGLAIMAWHHQQEDATTLIDWQAQIAKMQQQAAEMHEEAEAAQALAVALRQEAETAQQQRDEVQLALTAMQATSGMLQNQVAQVQHELETEQARAVALQQEAETARQDFGEVQRALTMQQAESALLQNELEQVQQGAICLQSQLDEMQPISQAWHRLNLETQTLALFNAGLLTAQTAAEKLGVHTTTVRRKGSKLNGVGGRD